MKTFKGNSSKHTCYYVGISLLILGFILAFFQATGAFLVEQLLPSCYFYAITNLPCPGCGITRAIQALLSFEFTTSFWHNPVVLYTFLFFMLYMASHTLELILYRFPSKSRFQGMRPRWGYLYFFIILLLMQWIIKLLYLLIL